jgi:hypothetical protein
MIEDPPNGHSLGIALEPEGKRLSRAEFQGLGDMPPELEWFANLDNPRTGRAYRLGRHGSLTTPAFIST